MEKFITESIKTYRSEDGYYGITAQMLAPESFVDYEGLKAYLDEKIKEGDKNSYGKTKFCSYDSYEDAYKAVEADKGLHEFMYWYLSGYVGIYDDTETCWGMAKISEDNFGIPIVSVSREICC